MAYQDRQAENRARARRTNRNSLIIVGAIIGLLCLCGGIGSVFGDDNDAEQPAPTTTRATPTTTRPTTTRAPTSVPMPLESVSPPAHSATDSAPAGPPVTHAPEPTPAPPVASVPEPERAPEPTAVPPPPAPEPEPTIAPPPPAPSNVYYKNCAAARAAGAAPLYAGEPGYRSGLDRDGDGVACE
ncbi:excalibur calcium-binding domain-containing protein [Nocardia higoensis]|nr:excalibur calcium-binding domain-containing protein [Nocardia higoensis]